MQFAADQKLDKAKFKACLDDKTTLDKIHKDKEEGWWSCECHATFFVNVG